MARDPRDKKVDHGRSFDIYDNIMWMQRVEKEERSLLHEDKMPSYNRKSRRKQDADIRRLEAKVLGREHAMRDSTTSAMYRSNGLPDKYRALNRWPVRESCMITCKPKTREEEGLVPKLRFKSGYVDAMWVPGTGKILQHCPEFYLEKKQSSTVGQQKLEPWALPPAGSLIPSPFFGEPSAEPVHASLVGRASSPGSEVGRSASRTSFMRGVRSAASMCSIPESALAGAHVSASPELQFQIGGPAVAGSRNGSSVVQSKNRSARRSRSSTLVAAGDAVLPLRQAYTPSGRV